MLDAAYNFNMIGKNPLNLRTLWFTFCYFESNFVFFGLYLTGFMFIGHKLINSIPFTSYEFIFINVEIVLSSIIIVLYYIVVR